MIFKRRNLPGLWEQVRIALWPRTSWLRSAKYFGKRVIRLRATPHSVAAGVAAGVFASCTPFMGFHFVVAFAVAFLLGGNMIAAAAGTFAGNPLTFPLIWASTLRIGNAMLGPDHAEHFDFTQLSLRHILHSFESLLPLLKPMAIGAVPVGILAGIAAYLVTRTLSATYRLARQKRLKAPKRGRLPAGPTLS